MWLVLLSEGRWFNPSSGEKMDSFFYWVNAQRVQEIVQRQFKNHESKSESHVCVIMEDFFFNGHKLPSEFSSFLMNSRVYNVTLINAMQCCDYLPPDIRANLDCVFVFFDPSQHIRHRLYKFFFHGHFESFEAFEQAFKSVSDVHPYAMFVLDQRGPKHEVRWFVADPECVPRLF